MAASVAFLGQASFLRPGSLTALTSGQSLKQNGKLRTHGHVSPVAKFDLQPPPYELDALEPHISKTTLEFHWGKHHRAYVNNLNAQIEGTDLDTKTLEEVVISTYNNGSPGPQFNNAGQIWNHDFYWGSVQPNGGGLPTGQLKDLINRDFGSYEKFVTDFKAAGATQFGSGWAWLVLKKDGTLGIEKTPNAVTPILWDSVPLLVIDVWEHAYYLDYQNRRPDYLTTFIDKLISWESAEKRLIAALAKVNPAQQSVPK
eukprot:TRINITY_DN4920_c0_g1_i1.p1 TRINITY_DN4920_c0_g1~~TRINITY_DN4920_c0_g1_i1.p1  ORF type:complete len:257 (+),score=56.96 TRINITY_DN4920_c0_g1_i1:161-931(+)